jgi:hypothetical protein
MIMLPEDNFTYKIMKLPHKLRNTVWRDGGRERELPAQHTSTDRIAGSILGPLSSASNARRLFIYNKKERFKLVSTSATERQ